MEDFKAIILQGEAKFMEKILIGKSTSSLYPDCWHYEIPQELYETLSKQPTALAL